MSKISETFKNNKSLIIYLTAGDPSLSITEKLIYDFEKAGADIIEIGIPFSDPLADGPIIQASHIRGIKSKTDLKRVFATVKIVRKKSKIPIVFMLACNLVEQYGAERFYADCEKSGVDGVLVPDMPPEEIRDMRYAIRDRILMIAPTTKDERIKMITDKATGFIYLVSVLGVTGKRTSVSGDISLLVQRVKKYTDKPVAIGFGISNEKQAKEAVKHADGVIVGSAVVDLIGKKKFKAAVDLVKRLRMIIDPAAKSRSGGINCRG